jgi:hypothetical protein
MEELIELGIDEKELTHLTMKLMKNKEWLYNNYDDITEKYAHQYIAIFDEKVLESDNDLKRLKEKLRKILKDPDTVLIELINPKEITLIL